MRIRLLRAVLGAVALLAMPLAADDGAKAPLLSGDLPKYGVGAYGNVGIATPGFSAVPGIGGILGDYQAGLHVGKNGDMLQLAASADWLYLNQALPGLPLSFFAGPGLYGAVGSDFEDETELGVGLRAVGGIRTIALGMLEAHAALVPAIGATLIGESAELNWSVGLELGIRYAIPRKRGMKLAATLPETPWTPDGDGLNDALGLAASAVDEYPIVSWTFEVADPTGKPFYARTVKQVLPATIDWDGNSDKGEKVVSMQNYAYTLAVTDSLGITEKASGSIPVDIVFIKKGNDFQLDLTGFVFVPNSPKLVSDDSDAGKENRRLLAALKAALQRMDMYDTTIVGHAINVSGTEKEEKELLPLSVARSEAIKAELKKLGLDVTAITTKGKGGTEPIVPNSDQENKWKNRRVEFLMTPKGAVK